ncbi:MAG: DUF4271 domain-containing protein [Ginsengibacter sp.]
MKVIVYLPLLFLLGNRADSQRRNDSLGSNSYDTSLSLSADSARRPAYSGTVVLPLIRSYSTVVNGLLSSNKFINVKEPAVFYIAAERPGNGKELVFYTLCVIVLILGLFKTFYRGYFNNLFRVFFNTSIRQMQLTDQLLQAKLPSFILNIFFAITTGFYTWLLFKNYHPPRFINSQLLLPVCILAVGVLYFAKYCILKCIGWMSGMQQAADNYIFVIFMVNKIIGIILVPFIVVLSFSPPPWINNTTIVSALILGLFFLSRYIKTYGALEYKFPLKPLHLIIYITALEIVPILLIYKAAADYLV